MTYTVHDPRLVYAAVVTRLAGQTSKNIGLAEAPDDKTLPYAVVYPVDDTGGGSLGDPQDTTVHRFQVTSVGGEAEQAMWMLQKVRAALLGWKPTVSGYTLGRVDKLGSQPVQRDDSTQPPLYYAVDDFDVFTS